jgi:thioredoxin-related protein
MKNALFSILSVFVLLSAQAQEVVTPISIGTTMPEADREMRSAAHGASSLNQLMGTKGLIVIFSSNSCPFVVGGKDFAGWEKTYNNLYDVAQKLGFNLVLVNSNEAKRNNGEGYEDMIKRATSMNYKMPYLLDANHVLADAFGAKTTPHVFFFGADKNLKYTGSIDNAMEQEKRKNINYLDLAMKQVAKGKKVRFSSTPPIGCSVKRQAK